MYFDSKKNKVQYPIEGRYLILQKRVWKIEGALSYIIIFMIWIYWCLRFWTNERWDKSISFKNSKKSKKNSTNFLRLRRDNWQIPKTVYLCIRSIFGLEIIFIEFLNAIALQNHSFVQKWANRIHYRCLKVNAKQNIQFKVTISLVLKILLVYLVAHLVSPMILAVLQLAMKRDQNVNQFFVSLLNHFAHVKQVM